MLEKTGNLWDFIGKAHICVTTNGQCNSQGALVMGKGVALQAKERFLGLDTQLGTWVRQYGNRVFLVRKHKLFSFPTKYDWRDPSDIQLIERSAKQLVEICDKEEIIKVVLSRPGCGCGGLEWSDVKKVIGPLLDNRFTVLNIT